MDSRAQFEAWCGSAGFDVSRSNDGDYNDFATDTAWEGCQASRATIEVELPEKISPHNTNESGYVIGQAAMYDEAIDDCAEAIRAIGISIKGESS